MGRESTQQKLSRVRAPRVQITYDVETGGAIELKELPFVMGVLGDLTGHPEQPLAALKDRKFVEINPDNFDSVLKGMQPHLKFKVENKLSDKAGQIAVDLKFDSMDDFSPAKVAEQVGPIKELLDLRTRLSNLRGSLQGNDQLDQALFDAVSNTEELNKLKTELDKKSEGGN
ncbi:type VI secretion system contractile sheath small subunit [Terracidiphilus gabretensis]|jgi:type VI secretion system protein ImpB|uniref:type VI secretion system contractile sheath small subunit n=1 Tax=Terracidiphilus gabretensis TaxID=1577687 RepID=UPI00071BE9EB|nr:type VI secretion system contractile sheath small subunit [Terracidiphilus gabretensis]